MSINLNCLTKEDGCLISIYLNCLTKEDGCLISIYLNCLAKEDGCLMSIYLNCLTKEDGCLMSKCIHGIIYKYELRSVYDISCSLYVWETVKNIKRSFKCGRGGGAIRLG